MSGYGSGAWGGIPWGGGTVGTIDLLAAIAIRENVVRISFTAPFYFSAILDAPDASVPSKYAVTAIAGTAGMDGEPVRSVGVASVEIPDDVPTNAVGFFLDVVLDRPMTAFPARYTVSVSNIFSADLSVMIALESLDFDAVYHILEIPRIDQPSPSRDIANPQTLNAAQDSVPDPNNAAGLGTYRPDDTGDYATDEGETSMRKRIYRRLFSKKNGYAHLPGYGVGIPSRGKMLMTSGAIAALASDAEAQIAREPDVAKVRVKIVTDPNVPGLARVQVFVRPRVGAPQRFDFLTPTA